MRRKCFVSRASFRHVPMLFRKSFFETESIGFDIIRADTCACPNELINQAVSYRVLWNCLGEINYGFAESRDALFQIVNSVLPGLFTDNPFCIPIPERIIGATRLLDFGFHDSFVIRHSSFVIDQR